ncbi:hypothetical protein GLYMA_20G082100v4 [Glycine max]|nr:hypothetical protein GLYMA_20G082100v4 [Glycine max]KAH1035126.1 hypothetical protein GYH30_055206 [Glycine max]KAH1190118.1 hypothetical protein GmHk_20G057754 [Glycine max]
MALHSCVLTVIVTTPSPFVSTAIVLQSCALVVTTMTLLFAYSVSLTLNPFILFLLPLSLLLVPVNSFVSARFGFLELMLTVIFVERQKVWVSGIGVWERWIRILLPILFQAATTTMRAANPARLYGPWNLFFMRMAICLQSSLKSFGFIFLGHVLACREH